MRYTYFDMKQCMKCGRICEDTDSYCPVCGTRLEANTLTPSAQEGRESHNDHVYASSHSESLDIHPSFESAGQAKKETSPIEKLSKLFKSFFSYLYAFLALEFALVFLWLLFGLSLGNEKAKLFWVVPMVLGIAYAISFIAVTVSWISTMVKMAKLVKENNLARSDIRLNKEIVFKGMTKSCFGFAVQSVGSMVVMAIMASALLGGLPLACRILLFVYGGLETLFLLLILLLELTLGKKKSEGF